MIDDNNTLAELIAENADGKTPKGIGIEWLYLNALVAGMDLNGHSLTELHEHLKKNADRHSALKPQIEAFLKTPAKTEAEKKAEEEAKAKAKAERERKAAERKAEKAARAKAREAEIMAFFGLAK